MKNLLNQIESIALEWNNLLVNMFKMGNDVDIILLKNRSQHCLKIQQTVQAIHWEDELKEFINKWKGVHFVDEIILTPRDLTILDDEKYNEDALEIMNGNDGYGCDIETKQCSSRLSSQSTPSHDDK